MTQAQKEANLKVIREMRNLLVQNADTLGCTAELDDKVYDIFAALGGLLKATKNAEIEEA